VLLNTASAVVSFLTKMEEETAKFYEELSRKYPDGKEIFHSFSKDNEKNKIMIQRVYYGVITDALEACFSFKEGIDSQNYVVRTEIAENASFVSVLKLAIEIEETIRKAYIHAATLSEGLMADVPQAFRAIAKKRGDRITKLKAILDGKNNAK
jgi:rubrerythrin